MFFARRSFLRQSSLVLVSFILSIGFAGCSGQPEGRGGTELDSSETIEASSAHVRDGAAPVVLLGFDGVDPRLARQWIQAGHLPNLAALAEINGVKDMGTTCPPQSPCAWSTFTTGVGPGDHGIFDFIIRTPPSYLPESSGGSLVKPKLDADGRLQRAAYWKGGREGTSFWSLLDRAGLASLILAMPYDFPPKKLKHGHELVGLGTPDIAGRNSFFYAFATDTEARSVPGGKIVPVTLRGDVAESQLEGPYDPRGRSGAKIALPIRFTRDTAGQTLAVRIGDVEQTVAVRGWSDWFRIAYPLSDTVRVKAICKVFVESVEPELRVYVGPQNMDPEDPMLPFTSPEDFAGQLAARHGLFKTIGWIHDTNAMRAGRLDEETFLQDAYAGMDARSAMLFHALDEGAPPLLMAIYTVTDRVSHLFFRYLDKEHPGYDPQGAERHGDAILETYRRMDAVVGEVVRRLDPKAKLFVMSDHGFHSYRQAFAVNTWLVENGYMILKGQKNASDLEGARKKMGKNSFFMDVDWLRTRAYSMGMGQVYINLRDRESRGIVEASEYDGLVHEIAEKLLATTDPTNGVHPIGRVSKRAEVFQGRFEEVAPDIQIGYAPGYQVEKSTILGGVSPQVFAPNLDAWSGDHASSDWRETPGFLLTNFKLSVESPSIVDFAPTFLRHFGSQPPPEMTGQPWKIE